MTGKPLIGAVVGPTTPTHWGQVLTNPNAYGVVEVAYEDGGARGAGIHLLSRLSQKLEPNPTGLHELEDIADHVLKDGVKTVLLCVPVGNVVYVVLRGMGDVYLRRGRQFARLLHDTGSISGEIQPDDTIILASAEFSRAMTQEEAGDIFDHLTPEEVAERLTLLLHEKPYGEGSAALVLQFGEGQQQETTPHEKTAMMRRLSQTKVFLSHFHPRRVRRHLSLAVLKHDIERLKRHPKKATFLLTAALIVLFGVAVAIGIWKQTIRGVSPVVAAAVVDARHNLDEGVALLSLNPVKGRERLTTAKQLLDPLTKSVSSRSKEGREITDLLRQVNDNLRQSMQITSITPELFFDGALVKKGATISYIGLEGTTMGLIDTATQTVIVLDVTSKKATVLGGGATYAGMSFPAVHGDAMYILTDSGIHKVGLTDKQTQQSVVKPNPEWGRVAALDSFGGNLYLLDTQKSRIWKYIATETGFSELKEYLNPDTLPDLSQANSLAIDGSVWLGSINGTLWKFTGGKEDTFIPKGVDPAFGKNLIIYTSDTVNNLYVLDSDNKRVVVLQKDGTYLAQYVWTDAIIPNQLAVSESEKKIYLLAAGKLYAIGLK